MWELRWKVGLDKGGLDKSLCHLAWTLREICMNLSVAKLQYCNFKISGRDQWVSK